MCEIKCARVRMMIIISHHRRTFKQSRAFDPTFSFGPLVQSNLTCMDFMLTHSAHRQCRLTFSGMYLCVNIQFCDVQRMIEREREHTVHQWRVYQHIMHSILSITCVCVCAAFHFRQGAFSLQLFFLFFFYFCFVQFTGIYYIVPD